MNWLNKNKVLLIGLLTAILLAVSNAMQTGASSTKVFIFAGIIAALSFLAQNLRGQWVTIVGVLGTAVGTYVTMEQTGTVSWNQLIVSTVLAILAVVAPPPKSTGYEKTAVIESAKIQGEKITKNE